MYPIPLIIYPRTLKPESLKQGAAMVSARTNDELYLIPYTI